VEVREEPQAPVVEAPEAAFAVAWEDEHLLVVDKPAGVVVHPARGHRGATLTEALAGQAAGGEDPARAGIVHRLDKDTSGLLVIARSEAVHRTLQELIRRRELRREYLALVAGCPPARAGTIDAPIGRDRRTRTRMSTDTDVPRAARTHFELERAYAGYALLRVTLETGRTHQIRVHLQAIGHPVAGDPEYGDADDLGLARQFLHATRLAFAHPISGEPVDVSSPLPPELQGVLARLDAGTV
jgi:23S rRNA pseudouridine1911/1915/1917 synthase